MRVQLVHCLSPYPRTPLPRNPPPRPGATSRPSRPGTSAGRSGFPQQLPFPHRSVSPHRAYNTLWTVREESLRLTVASDISCRTTPENNVYEYGEAIFKPIAQLLLGYRIWEEGDVFFPENIYRQRFDATSDGTGLVSTNLNEM